jgi:two-component system phosphate regulon sensor histidine kinase PhoR
MKLKNIGWIAGFVAVAFAALIGVQLYWVQNAYDLRQKQVEGQVKEALNKTARIVERDMSCFESYSKVQLQPHEGIYIARQGWKGEGEWIPLSKQPLDTAQMYIQMGNEKKIYNFNHMLFTHPTTADILVRFRVYSTDTASMPVLKEGEMDEKAAEQFRQKFVGDKPISEKIDLHLLDSVLKQNMSVLHFGSTYHYGISRADKDIVEYASKGTDTKRLMKSGIQSPFLQGNYFNRPYKLSLYFDEAQAVFLETLWGILSSSILVVIILLGGFFYFIRIILRQKKLSEMKTDFINNMTHEFKTPITNISLALETISEQVLDKDSRNGMILRIINEENERLKGNVEKILQIAMVEKEEVEMQPVQLDLHLIIKKAVHNFHGHTSSRQADIRLSLQAADPMVVGDETHIINVVYNLLDNALKYSSGKPLIEIGTRNENNGIALSVQDHGIGMSNETQKRIFDKFYRAHTGNIHNVKGFGLGLSYVKSIVEAHHGNISVKSELEKGSLFKIFFPYRPTIQKMEA